MKKQYFYLLIISLILIFPTLVFADRGMVIWPPDVHLDQTAQNAIVAWNGEEEIIILSANIESSGGATVLEILPLPSNPIEIKEGDPVYFEKLVELMNEKIHAVRQEFLARGEEAKAPATGIEITFHEKIGAHDVKVVKVNDLDYFLSWIEDFAEEKGFSPTYELECEKYHYSTCPEGCLKKCIPSVCSPDGVCTADCDGPGSCSGGKIEKHKISSEFRQGVNNYLKRDIKYFVFDVIETGKKEESINPLIYRFDSEALYYPLLISGISEIGESIAEIYLFLITEKEAEMPDIPYSYYSSYWFSSYGYPVELTKEELKEVSEDLADLFEAGVKVRKAYLSIELKRLNRDLRIYPSYYWDKYLVLGSSGKEVETLQKILINEGVWGAEVGATGYFGAITKNALAKFQEKYSQEILRPIGLEEGTGYFGPNTQAYLKKLSIEVEKIKEEIKWTRNLTIGMEGEDVKALQKILIKEGIWLRQDIEPTGYFGPITQDAVIRFQEKYTSEILQSLGLVKGTGFVGSSTRAYLEKISKE